MECQKTNIIDLIEKFLSFKFYLQSQARVKKKLNRSINRSILRSWRNIWRILLQVKRMLEIILINLIVRILFRSMWVILWRRLVSINLGKFNASIRWKTQNLISLAFWSNDSGKEFVLEFQLKMLNRMLEILNKVGQLRAYMVG